MDRFKDRSKSPLKAHWLVTGEVALCRWRRFPDPESRQSPVSLEDVVLSFINDADRSHPVLLVLDLSQGRLDDQALNEVKALLNRLVREYWKDRISRTLVITSRRYWSTLKLQGAFQLSHEGVVDFVYNWQLADLWLARRGYKTLSYPQQVQRELLTATAAMRVVRNGHLLVRSIRGSLTVLQAASTLRANLEFTKDLPAFRNVLVDVRKVQVSRSGLESRTLMDQECGDISQLPVPNRQVLLCSPENLEPSRFLCDWMGTQGMVALACTDLETACLWLEEDPAFIQAQLNEIGRELGKMEGKDRGREVFAGVIGDADACFAPLEAGRLLVGRFQGAFDATVFLDAQHGFPSSSDQPGGRAVLLDVRQVREFPSPQDSREIFEQVKEQMEKRKTFSTIAILCRPSQLATCLVWCGYFSPRPGYTKPFTDIEKACKWLGKDSATMILTLDLLASYSLRNSRHRVSMN